ncbi:MAG: hypothetical protein HOC71_17860 [Candidatus Latescibacteria bacterium]|jgi:hypothetical protein|nr:hypothetical protein [Candidatus Latescibacterota bacterium]
MSGYENSPRAGEWFVGQLRLTIFPSSPQNITDVNWWADLTGEQPEEKVIKPNQGFYSESGPFENNILLLNVVPPKIDWVWAIPINKQVEPDRIPVIGDYFESHEFFVNIMEKWLNSVSDIKFNRLAYGAVLLMPVKDKVSGYKKIANYLPEVRLDPENSRDFFYQINRPRHYSSKPELSINRLMKWKVLKQSYFLSTSPQSVMATAEDNFACQVELDINTSNEISTELPSEEIINIWHELALLGIEISEKGDF